MENKTIPFCLNTIMFLSVHIIVKIFIFMTVNIVCSNVMNVIPVIKIILFVKMIVRIWGKSALCSINVMFISSIIFPFHFIDVIFYKVVMTINSMPQMTHSPMTVTAYSI